MCESEKWYKAPTYKTNYKESIEKAMGWVNTDREAVEDDIKRLGIEESTRYQMDLIEQAIDAGDDRWRDIRPSDMLNALSSLSSNRSVESVTQR